MLITPVNDPSRSSVCAWLTFQDSAGKVEPAARLLPAMHFYIEKQVIQRLSFLLWLGCLLMEVSQLFLALDFRCCIEEFQEPARGLWISQ